MRLLARRSRWPHRRAGHRPRQWWPGARRRPRPLGVLAPARPWPGRWFPGRTWRRCAAAGHRSARGLGAARRWSCHRSAPPPPAPGLTRPASAPGPGSGGRRTCRPQGACRCRDRLSRAGLSSASPEPPWELHPGRQDSAAQSSCVATGHHRIPGGLASNVSFRLLSKLGRPPLATWYPRGCFHCGQRRRCSPRTTACKIVGTTAGKILHARRSGLLLREVAAGPRGPFLALSAAGSGGASSWCHGTPRWRRTWRCRLRLRTVGSGLVRPVPVAVAYGLWGYAMVTEQQVELSFAGLLRRLRAEAKLTQEELAAAAGVSPWAVSNLERGFSRTAHKDTAVLLAGALGLTGPAEELFVAAARGTVPPLQVLAAADGAKPRPGVAAGSPYRGLAVFGEQDAEW